MSGDEDDGEDAATAVGDREADLVNVMFSAIVDDKPGMLRLALAGGADINSLNEDGWTPLQMACFLRNKDIVKLLLANPKCM